MARRYFIFASKPRPPLNIRAKTTAERLNLRRFHANQRRIAKGKWTRIGKSVQLTRFDNLLKHFADNRPLQDIPKNYYEDPKIITFKDCSFIENPNGALEVLAEIARADHDGMPYRINFLDKNCPDLAPILVFSLMRKAMRKGVCKGGKVSKRLATIFRAIKLSNFAGMKVGESDHCEVWPITVRSIEVPASAGVGKAIIIQQRTASEMARAINSWLAYAGYELTDDAYASMVTLFGEILDNSRHANEKSVGVEWTIAGFMTPVEGEVQFDCYFTIITLGRSFSQSLENADDNSIREVVLDYADRHINKSSLFSKSSLMTSLALQDNITSDGRGGCGMSNFVNMVTALGTSDNPPKIVIVSGDACIRVVPQYGRMHMADDGTYIQFFNENQSFREPPSDLHVFRLARSFPGTVISTRFVIDSDDLARKTNGNARQ